MGIPSDEDFARAKQRMSERWHGVDRALSELVEHFRNAPSVSRIEVVPGDDSVSLYIFYKTDCDIERNQNEGLTDKIASFFRRALSEAGRSGVKVDVVVDSHQNVVSKYGGSYFMRLR